MNSQSDPSAAREGPVPDFEWREEPAPAPPDDRQQTFSWLDLLEVADESSAPKTSRLEAFLNATSLPAALRLWLGPQIATDREGLLRRLNRDIADLDRLINQQLNAVLHHPAFQKLEASWRGLRYLVDRMDEEGDRRIEIRVLHVTWAEVERDLERAAEFDQSQLFHKIYEDEFGAPGGVPFSVLLGDYEIHPRITHRHPQDDLGMLASLAGIAAAAFCPFIASVNPAMFGLDDFAGLESQLDHAKTLERPDYLKWNTLRQTEDARFVGLLLPRVLMRSPYARDGTHADQFCFREDVDGPDCSKYLWGSPIYAFGGVLIRAFARSGWLADIRGVQQDVDGGGLVTGLPIADFATDSRSVARKPATDVVVTDGLERELSELGFICLCDGQDTEFAAFYSSPSIQRPRRYDRTAATANARMSAMLNYILCVSRFAHYLKVLSQDKIGSLNEPGELEQYLQDWINHYVTPDVDAPPQTKAKYPLREASVHVENVLGKAGVFQCVMRLAPHYQLEELSASLHLTTQLAPPRIP